MMIMGELSLPALISIHLPFIKFSLPCPAEKGGVCDKRTLVDTCYPAKIEPPQLLRVAWLCFVEGLGFFWLWNSFFWWCGVCVCFFGFFCVVLCVLLWIFFWGGVAVGGSSKGKNIFFHSVSINRCSCPLIIFMSFLWIHFNRSISFQCWGLQRWMQHCRWDLTRAEQRGTVPSFNLLATLLELLHPFSWKVVEGRFLILKWLLT